MKVGAEDRKKLITAGVLGFCAIGAVVYLYLLLFGGPSAPPPPTAPVITTKSIGGAPAGTAAVAASTVPGFKPVAGNAAVKVGTASGKLDPTLHMEGMLAAEAVLYTGTGRNIFAAGAAQAPPVKIEPVKFQPRPPPGPPPVQVAQGPPPPPPINLKFFGTATQRGVRRALLLSGDDVFLAAQGDIVQRRYRIVTISANSITVEDMPNTNQQSLPLVAN